MAFVGRWLLYVGGYCREVAVIGRWLLLGGGCYRDWLLLGGGCYM